MGITVIVGNNSDRALSTIAVLLILPGNWHPAGKLPWEQDIEYKGFVPDLKGSQFSN